MRRLPLALPLAVVVALVATTTPARGACPEEPEQAERVTAPADDSHEGDCSDCTDGCLELCCQGPVGVTAPSQGVAVDPPHARLAAHPAVLTGELHGPGVFQPPRG